MKNQYKTGASKNPVWGLYFFDQFLGLAILIIILALTGFIANKRGPKTGQVKWADLDALV